MSIILSLCIIAATWWLLHSIRCTTDEIQEAAIKQDNGCGLVTASVVGIAFFILVWAAGGISAWAVLMGGMR